MPSRKTRASYHASRKSRRNQSDSHLRVCLSLPPATNSLTVRGEFRPDRALRQSAPMTRSTHTIRADSLKQDRPASSKCKYTSTATTVRPGPGAPHRSRHRKPLRLWSPRPDHTRTGNWQTRLASTSTCGAPPLKVRPSLPRRHRLGTRHPTADRSTDRLRLWVVLWVLATGIGASIAGLLTYMLVSRSGAPPASAELAGVTTWTATARISLAFPSAIKALRDLRI